MTCVMWKGAQINPLIAPKGFVLIWGSDGVMLTLNRCVCGVWAITHIPKGQQDRIKIQQHTKEQEK